MTAMGGDSISDPWNNRRPDEYVDAMKAADALRAGRIVHWQPGDGSNYILLIANHRGSDKRFLMGVLRGHEWFAELPEPMEPQRLRWWVERMPRGHWAGMRPLLLALGLTTGDLVKDIAYDPRDPMREYEERQRGGEHDGTHGGIRNADRAAQNDAHLGRLVRYSLGAVGLIIDDSKLEPKEPDGSAG